MDPLNDETVDAQIVSNGRKSGSIYATAAVVWTEETGAVELDTGDFPAVTIVGAVSRAVVVATLAHPDATVIGVRAQRLETP
jgi:hypothetical protein